MRNQRDGMQVDKAGLIISFVPLSRTLPSEHAGWLDCFQGQDAFADNNGSAKGTLATRTLASALCWVIPALPCRSTYSRLNTC